VSRNIFRSSSSRNIGFRSLPRAVMWYNAPSYSIRKGLATKIVYHSVSLLCNYQDLTPIHFVHEVLLSWFQLASSRRTYRGQGVNRSGRAADCLKCCCEPEVHMIMLMSSQRLKHIKKKQKVLLCSLTTLFFKAFIERFAKSGLYIVIS
jgi:hypothetical protein